LKVIPGEQCLYWQHCEEGRGCRLEERLFRAQWITGGGGVNWSAIWVAIERPTIYSVAVLLATVGAGFFVVTPIVEAMYRLREGHSRRKALPWLPPLFGNLERLLYFLALVAGKWEFIVFWLTLKVGQKVLVRWQGPNQDKPELKSFEIYLAGSMLSLIGAVVGYALLKLVLGRHYLDTLLLTAGFFVGGLWVKCRLLRKRPEVLLPSWVAGRVFETLAGCEEVCVSPNNDEAIYIKLDGLQYLHLTRPKE